jgi:hypothetical protein
MIEMANTLRSFFRSLAAAKKIRMIFFKAFRWGPVRLPAPNGVDIAFCKQRPGGRCSSPARRVLFEKTIVKILRQKDFYRISLPVAASGG